MSAVTALSSGACGAAGARPWLEARKLLVVRLDSLGDLLMTTPAIAAIRHSSPGAKITLLTSSAGAAAAKHIPALADAIVCDALASPPDAAEGGRDAPIDPPLIDELAMPDAEACVTGMRHEVTRQIDLVASVGFHRSRP